MPKTKTKVKSKAKSKVGWLREASNVETVKVDGYTVLMEEYRVQDTVNDLTTNFLVKVGNDRTGATVYYFDNTNAEVLTIIKPWDQVYSADLARAMAAALKAAADYATVLLTTHKLTDGKSSEVKTK